MPNRSRSKPVMPKVSPRLPLDPVAVLLAPLMDDWGESRVCAPNRIASRLGVNTRQVYRWRNDGLTLRQAEVVAAELGLTPEMIWGAEAVEEAWRPFMEALEEHDRRAAVA